MSARIGLIFHGIGTPGRDLDPGEAPFWLSTTRFEHVLDRILALPDPSRLRISFDDGNASDIEIALPRLRDRGLSADVFALSGRLDRTGSLSSADLRALAAAGLRIGSHGIDHLNLRRLGPSALARELAGSKAALEAALGQPVIDFSVPFGAYDATVLRAIRAAGYTTAWTSDRGTYSDRVWLRPRTSVQAGMDDATLDRLLLGTLTPTEALRRHFGMLHRRLSRH
jgi:peptidoglycan/xylan/chitin deacetylase (PgdA/CDA1 family)